MKLWQDMDVHKITNQVALNASLFRTEAKLENMCGS